MADLSDRLLHELVDAVKDIIRKEQADRLRDVYLVGDIDKDSARTVIERLRDLANDSRKPIRLYINSAGGNVTDGLALHDAIRQLTLEGCTITIIVQGVGKTTRLINKLEAGDALRDVVGPLGKPSDIERFGTVVVIGGGVGTAIAYPTAVAMKHAGNRVLAKTRLQIPTRRRGR